MHSSGSQESGGHGRHEPLGLAGLAWSAVRHTVARLNGLVALTLQGRSRLRERR